MLRLLRMSKVGFGSIPPRRQNFFELNPVFPDQGQKDFDIYNVDYKHDLVGKLTNADEYRYKQIKDKLTKELYLKPVLENAERQAKGDAQIDPQFGFPIGMNENFDSFIEIFKREKKVGNNIVGQFENLVMSLMEKFSAKSEIELIKIFRFNLAKVHKNSLKDKLRSLIINSAFIKFIKQRKGEGLSSHDITIEQLKTFETVDHHTLKRPTSEITQEELQQIVTIDALRQLDQKIMKIEEQIQAKAVSDGTFIPIYHPKYGMAINQEVNSNQDFDMNFPRGFISIVETNSKQYSPQQIQDMHIETRINKLFFAQVVKQIQAKKQLNPEELIKIQNLPLNIRQKDKIINSLLYKYKEYDLLVEPDLKDIYNQIDMVLKKIVVKVVPNYLDNTHENQQGIKSEQSQVNERIISKDVLLWRQLDAEEVFEPELYNEDEVNKVIVQEKQIAELSPSALLELSLNKMPFNLYRHADLDHFSVFTKYRKKIYQDYLTDKVIDPEIEFKFFSLDQAKQKLQKIKKPEEIPDKIYGYARRKSSEAEVFLTKGTGKVIINNQPLADYCGDVYHRGETLKPLIFTETAGQFDLEFNVVGGGVHSQSQCMAMALAKALVQFNPKFEKPLSRVGLLGIDDRRKQPKRIGLYSARVRPPYVRR